MRNLRQMAACVLTAVLLCGSVTVSATGSNVSYSGDAGQFVFAPGSDQSVTDLFTDFKDIMPGDTLEQTITVRNNASNKVKVKLYLRALGAHEQSQEFLSQLTMVVNTQSGELFRAPANQSAQLTDWVLLGEFDSGAQTDLTVALQVPVELDNRFMDTVGFLDWQFMVEELPVEQPDDPSDPDNPDQPHEPDQPSDPEQPDDPNQPSDPEQPDDSDLVSGDNQEQPDVPKTGDLINPGLFGGLFVGSGALLGVTLWWLIRKKRNGADNDLE